MWLKYWKIYSSSSFSTSQWMLGILCVHSTLQSRFSRARPGGVGQMCTGPSVGDSVHWWCPSKQSQGLCQEVSRKLSTPLPAKGLCWRPCLAALLGWLSLATFQPLLGTLVFLEQWGVNAAGYLYKFLTLTSDERPFLPSCVSFKCLTSVALITGMGLFLSPLTSHLWVDHCWFSAEIWLDPASACHPVVMGVGYLFWSLQRQKGAHEHLARSTADRELWNR